MKNILVLIICCFLAFALLACGNENPAENESEQSEKINGTEEDEETHFSQDEFTLAIGPLPYRGAVLFIDYDGEVDISDYELNVDILFDDIVVQQNMPVEYVDCKMVAEIVDLMYLPGDELHFILKINEEDNEIFECNHSEQLQRYPWKDWMLADEEWFSLTEYDLNFKYNWPGAPNDLGAHSSWDIMTKTGSYVNLYSGTMGIVWICRADQVQIYNPYVGAVIQYGHVESLDRLRQGEIVKPGDFIGGTVPRDRHIHYSIIRPFRYTKYVTDSNVTMAVGNINVPDKYDSYYWPITEKFNQNRESIFDSKYYKDPFYFHEPTTLGYWNEEALPLGLKEELINSFKKWNSEIVLPATKPLDAD